jgi:hypothetical protein
MIRAALGLQVQIYTLTVHTGGFPFPRAQGKMGDLRYPSYSH